MENILEKVKETAGFLSSNGFGEAIAGVVLGTSLGSFVGEIIVERKIPYSAIPHFPQATVEFHKGQLIVGRIADKKVIVICCIVYPLIIIQTGFIGRVRQSALLPTNVIRITSNWLVLPRSSRSLERQMEC